MSIEIKVFLYSLYCNIINPIAKNMGACIASGMCCCFTMCCKECSESLQKLMGRERVTKFFYFFLVVVYTIPALLVFFLLDKWKSFVEYFDEWIKCPASSGGSSFECVGSSAIFRLSLSLLCLFFVMMLVMVCRNRCAMVFNEGLFCFKYLVVIGLFIGFLWVDNQVFVSFGQASQYISIGYMLLQSIILIDLFYLAGIKLVKKYDEGEEQYACYLIVLSFLGEAAALGLNILGYVFSFHNPGDNMDPYPAECPNTLWVNIITSLLLIAMPAIQLFRCNDQNSLLTTSLISVFVSYLAFICQFSYPYGGKECMKMDYGALVADVIVSTFFFIVTMYGSIMGGSGQVKIDQNTDLAKAVASGEKEEEESDRGNAHLMEEKEDEGSYEGWGWVKWHFYMCLAAIYVGMLITNWNSASIYNGKLQQSSFGFWVRIIMSWVTFLLYVWTMIAPRVCPERDFTVQ